MHDGACFAVFPIFALMLVVVGSSTATAQAPPPPPEPVYRETGFVTQWPGYPYEDKRILKNLDVGIVMSGRSPIAYAGGPPFFYLNLGATYVNRFAQLEARSMFVPLFVDVLLGVALINFNLAQSDDFPPFLQLMNSRIGQGVFELGHGKVGYVMAADETSSWMFALHSHGTFFGAPLGQIPAFAIGLGGGVTHSWIDPLWDLSLGFYAGPEIGDFQYYAGVELIWRRALVEHFGYYARYNTNVHYGPLRGTFMSAGYLEVGFSFGTWE